MERNPLDKPPIPSPFESAGIPAPPAQTANYAVTAVVTLIIGTAQWALSGLVGLWPVGLPVMGVCFLAALVATLGVARAGKAMNWRVRRENLPLIRRTADTNMKGAYLVITVLFPFLLVASLRGDLKWSLPIMLFSIPFSICSQKVEKKFKTMEAEPDAAGEYLALLTAWKEMRFGLKKEGVV